MSKQQNTEKPILTFDGFRGMDETKGHSDPACAADILNFRIRPDGSLQKRCGYRLLTDVGTDVRGCWSGVIGSVCRLYLATDEDVLSVDPVSGKQTSLGALPAPYQPVCFFFHRDALYLLNGNEFYRVSEEGLTPVIGYVPLIGKDWDNRAVGEPYEPRNILTRHARISYIISEPASMFLSVEGEVESIDRVEVNGEVIDASRYEFDTGFHTINVTGLSAYDRVTVYVTFAEGHEELRNLLCSCRYSISFGGPSSGRLFFWGGDAPSTIFCSSYVKQERLADAQRGYADSAPLYFPVDFEFTVGEGRYAVQGAERHYDRLLIFTEGDAWIVTEDSSGLDEFPTLGINSKIGCASPMGVTLAENDPVTVGNYAVWQWSGETDRLSERNATRLSDAIDPMLTPEDYLSAQLYYNRRQRELWMNVRTRNEIWVYHVSHRQWYRFDAIRADHLFDLDTSVAFLRGGKVFVFDEELSVDRESDGEERPIAAHYVSTVSDFGDETKKNLSRLILRGDLDGGVVDVTFSGRGTEDVKCALSDPSGSHSMIDRRVSSGSFRYGSVRLDSADGARPIVHSLTLRTR